MSDQTTDDQDKIDAYLDIIQERILAPIQNTEIQHYCTATLLLLFAAIDGLGKLLHSDDNAMTRDRIRAFLEYMGGDYKIQKEELAKLRNHLVHTAVVESFLSHTEIDTDKHLKKMGAVDFIYVNTMVMYRDFVESFTRFRSDIKHDPELTKRATDRLKWREYNPSDDLDTDDATPSPPPPIRFKYAK